MYLVLSKFGVIVFSALGRMKVSLAPILSQFKDLPYVLHSLLRDSSMSFLLSVSHFLGKRKERIKKNYNRKKLITENESRKN